MSAKQTIDKPDENVDEVADKLTEATIEDDAAAKKKEKKMRQKAKKEAAKPDDPNDKNGQEDTNNENKEASKSNATLVKFPRMVRDLHFPPQRRVGLDEIVTFVSVPNRFGALDSICEDKSSIDVHGALVYTFEGERG